MSSSFLLFTIDFEARLERLGDAKIAVARQGVLILERSFSYASRTSKEEEEVCLATPFFDDATFLLQKTLFRSSDRSSEMETGIRSSVLKLQLSSPLPPIHQRVDLDPLSFETTITNSV